MIRLVTGGKMRKAVPVLLAIALSTQIACTRTEKRVTQTADASAAIDSTPQEGGTVLRRMESDVNTLNFFRHTTTPEKDVLSYLYDPLIGYDENLQLVPGIAREWQISPDGKTYTFKLDPTATFSDGTAVTAADLVYTVKTIVDPTAKSAQLAGLFEGLDTTQTKAIDSHTAQIAFNKARASQLAAFNIAVLPEKVYSKGNFDKDFQNEVVGNGPYRMVRREAGKQIVLERRDDYRGRKPLIKSVIFKLVDADTVAWNALKTGELDETRVTSDTWKLEKDNPQTQKSIEFRRFYLLSYNFIPLNNKDPLLSDRRVRRALAMCLDRRAIINNLYHGTARIMTGPFTPDQTAFNPDVPAIEYDLTAARQLFEQAGWRDTDSDGFLDRNGKPFRFEMLLSSGNKTSADQAQIFQNALKSIGVQMDLRSVDGATFFDRVQKGKMQAAFLAWNLTPDPDVFDLFHSSQHPPNGFNIVQYSNPEVDQMLDQVRAELDPAKRIEIFHQLHARLAEDVPFIWTIQPSIKWAVSKRLRDVKEAKGLGLFSWNPGPLSWWISNQQTGSVATPKP